MMTYRRRMALLMPLVVLLLFAAFAPAAWGENNQRYLPLDSAVYPLLEDLRAEAAAAPLPPAYPYTVEQVEVMLEAVNPSLLSPTGRAAYDRVRELLHPKLLIDLPTFGLDLNVAATPELYWKLRSDTDWRYGYHDRKSLADIGVDLYGGSFLYGGGNLDLRQGHFADEAAANYTNIHTDFSYYDVQFPFRAFLSMGSGFFNFQLGRDPLNWGPGYSGTLVLSDTPDFYDFAKVSLFWNIFRYTGLFIGIPLLPTSADPSKYRKSTGYRSFILHRFDVTLFQRLDFAVMEGQMYGREFPNIAYFNPFVILHDFYDWTSASEIFSLEAEVRPFRYVSAYGQLAFNQIQTAYELARYGSSADAIPNAAGYLFGADIRYPIGGGYLEGGAEYVHTDPWMYIRETPYTSYFWRRKVLSNYLGSNVVITLPTGYSWGPDTNLGYFWTEYRIATDLTLRTDLSLVADGLQTVDTPYSQGPAAVAMTTPTGTAAQPAEYSTIVHLAGTWNPGATSGIDILRHFELSTDLFFINIVNFNHTPGISRFDVQVAFSISFSI